MGNEFEKIDLSKNSHDRHLNLFWFYSGSPTLENNITKAFINTFDSLSVENKKAFLSQICHVKIDYDPQFSLYLQSAPDEKIVMETPKNHRVLIAFSPTGKSWGYAGIDVNDKGLIKTKVKEALRLNNPDWEEKEIEEKAENELSDTIKIIENRGGSIPDAWIILYHNSIPDYCIAFENKLYDLNPFQLNNHCKKSLHLDNNNIEYVKYSEIIDCLVNVKEYMPEEFIRYMFILGYSNITNLAQLDTVDEVSIEKYASKRAIELLNSIGERCGKKAVYHRGWMWELQSNNDYNKEIGLCYNKETKTFEVHLYFCTNQNFAKWFYSKQASFDINSLMAGFSFERSFHFQMVGYGGNVSGTYCSWNSNCSPEQYINFWKDNYQLIKQSNVGERRILLQKMMDSDLIQADEYSEICKKSNAYAKKYNVVPEFGIHIKWSLEEAKKLDKEGLFACEIKDQIKRVYACFGIKDPLIN